MTMGRRRWISREARQALEAPLLRAGLAAVPRLPRWAVLGLARGLGLAA